LIVKFKPLKTKFALVLEEENSVEEVARDDARKLGKMLRFMFIQIYNHDRHS